MKFLNLFKKPQAAEDQVTEGELTSEEMEEPAEAVSTGTKMKVITALVVVGFAGYVAYWVQEPTELKTDVLDSTSTSSQVDSSPLDALMPTQAVESSTQEVSIVNFNFDPAVLNVEKGTTVLWTNKDAVPQTVTSDGFSSNSLAPGESFSYVFNQDGTFAYNSAFHPQMTGKVVVGSGANVNSLPVVESSTEIVVQNPVVTDQSSAFDTSVSAGTISNQAPAPTSALNNHSAAPDTLSTSVTKIVGEQKLTSSGPEDYFYALAFLGILALNKKKLFKLSPVRK